MQFLRSLNLPNRLTLLRVALTPLFFALLLLPIFPFCSGAGARALCRLGAAAVFGAAAITDLFDGRIARARSLVTDFGKFLDPIADKLMVFAAFLGLMVLERDDRVFLALLAAAALLTLAREFAVTGLRTLISGRRGTILPAGRLGKAKTVCQIVFVLAAILEPLLWGALGALAPDLSRLGRARPITYTAMAAMCALTVASGAVYFRDAARAGKSEP